jgi:hypothetical protein
MRVTESHCSACSSESSLIGVSSSPLKVATYQQFARLCMMSGFHSDKLGIEEMLFSKLSHSVSVVIGHQKIT